MIRRFIAEHAHRFLFSESSEPEVTRLRPRIVDASLLSRESAQWRSWHEEQAQAEQELIR